MGTAIWKGTEEGGACRRACGCGRKARARARECVRARVSWRAGSDARLAIPVAVGAATMAFSYVVGAAAPPVGYATRAHLLVLQVRRDEGDVTRGT